MPERSSWPGLILRHGERARNPEPANAPHDRPPEACLDVNRSSRIAPHAPHCGLASRRGELVYLDEAEPLVAVVVAPVARFEVCGHALLVQPGQVRGQQAHPLALSAVVWVRTEEGQVPVR